jgi:hypothetical protein
LAVFAAVTTAGLVIYFSLRNKDDKKSYSTNESNSSDGKIKSILFIGDSNTVANYSYADQLKKIYPNLKIKKIAKVGEKTDWMKNKLINELNSGNKYDVVGVLSGSNDIYALGKNDSAKRNMNYMYDLIHSKGSKVLAVTPPNKDYYVKNTDQKQKELFDLVDWMKGNNKIDYLVDFHKITGDKKYFSANDGYLHANSSAHKILTDKVSNILNII